MSAAATLSILFCLRYGLVPHARGRAGFLLTSLAFGNRLIWVLLLLDQELLLGGDERASNPPQR